MNYLKLVKSKYTLFTVIIILLLSIIFDFVTKLTIIGFLIALGTVSMMYGRYIKISLGIELNTLGIIVGSILFDPIIGILIGVITFSISMIYNEHLFNGAFISIFGIVVMGIIASLLSNLGVTIAGLIAIIVFDVIVFFGYLYLGSSIGRVSLFVCTHLAFNAWVMITLAPKVLGLLLNFVS